MARLLGRKLEYGELAKVGAQGDYLVVASFNQGNRIGDDTVTNTTWGSAEGLMNFMLRWNMLLLEGADQVYVNLIVFLTNDTAGETTYFGLFNQTESEKITEVSHTGTDWKYAESGWTPYTPPTKDSPLRFRGQNKVTGGTGRTRDPTVYLALKL